MVHRMCASTSDQPRSSSPLPLMQIGEQQNRYSSTRRHGSTLTRKGIKNILILTAARDAVTFSDTPPGSYFSLGELVASHASIDSGATTHCCE